MGEPGLRPEERDWDEVTLALDNIVEAAARVRGSFVTTDALPAAAAGDGGGETVLEADGAPATPGPAAEAADGTAGEAVPAGAPGEVSGDGAAGDGAPDGTALQAAGPASPGAPRKRRRRRGSHGRRRPGPPSPETSPSA